MDPQPLNSDLINQKYASTSEIIAKYNRDNKDFPVDTYDAIEWIAEVARDVGDYDEFERQIWRLNMVNRQALAPCGIYKIESVKASTSSNQFIPYEYDGVYIRPYQDLSSLIIEFDGLVTDVNGYPMILKDQKKPAAMYIFLMGHAKPQWKTGKMEDYIYKELKKEYEIAVGEARGSFRNFSKNKREEIVRIWQNMITHYKISRPFQEGILWNTISTNSQVV